ncbi:FYN-binding protein 1 isoform X2 [Lepisosteus oculatus]|uniref:FYN-binding protein 1 isoform X2 n=1 Tax=Lepisosteus oculatus TaxID=7918 RepID=UPI00073FF717|nr:PREDICTED: uncharacterized protein C1orf168 homolog isoform X2 [Lepisosteus oculatus]
MEQEEGRDIKGVRAMLQHSPAFLRNGKSNKPAIAEKPKVIPLPENRVSCLHTGIVAREGKENVAKTPLSLPPKPSITLQSWLQSKETPVARDPNIKMGTPDNKAKRYEGLTVSDALRQNNVQRSVKPGMAQLNSFETTHPLPGKPEKLNCDSCDYSKQSSLSVPPTLMEELTRVLLPTVAKQGNQPQVSGKSSKEDLESDTETSKTDMSVVSFAAVEEPASSQASGHEPQRADKSGFSQLQRNDSATLCLPASVIPENKSKVNGTVPQGHAFPKTKKQLFPMSSPIKPKDASWGTADLLHGLSTSRPELPAVDYLMSEDPIPEEALIQPKKHQAVVTGAFPLVLSVPCSQADSSPYSDREIRAGLFPSYLEAEKPPLRRPLPDMWSLGKAPEKPPRPEIVDLKPLQTGMQYTQRQNEPEVLELTKTSAGDTNDPNERVLCNPFDNVYDDIELRGFPPSASAQKDQGVHTNLDSGSQQKNEEARKNMWFVNSRDRSESSDSQSDKEQKKRERQRIEKERKEQREKERRENEIKKKFNITGLEEPLYHARVIAASKSWRNDLQVKVGETVSIIRTTNCPQGKWLARDCDSNYGYVLVKDLELDIKEILELGKKTSQAVRHSSNDEDSYSVGSRSSALYPVSTGSFTDDSEEWSCDDELILPPEVHLPTPSDPEANSRPVSADCTDGEAAQEDSHYQMQNEALQKLATFFQSRVETKEQQEENRDVIPEIREKQSTVLLPMEEKLSQDQNPAYEPIEIVQNQAKLKEKKLNSACGMERTKKLKVMNPYLDLPTAAQSVTSEERGSKSKNAIRDKGKKNGKKITKEEKEFRKKFQYTKPIEVQGQAVVNYIIVQEFPDSCDLPILPGENLDIIDVSSAHRLICRNMAGKYGSVLLENLTLLT